MRRDRNQRWRPRACRGGPARSPSVLVRYNSAMPLHDWAETTGWEGIYLFWMTELARHLRGRLPSGFRPYLGPGPAVAVGSPPGRPDVSVRSHSVEGQPAPAETLPTESAPQDEPDLELAVMALETLPYVERAGRMVAAVELVSPLNKDRPEARSNYMNRYAGYLVGGIHLLLVDVHPRPRRFSFADGIARMLGVPNQPALPPPMAVSYRVGEPAATGGRFLAIWRRNLMVGAALPAMRLPLDVDLAVEVELEATYMRAAADAYLG
jgi:hypothetical protein